MNMTMIEGATLEPTQSVQQVTPMGASAPATAAAPSPLEMLDRAIARGADISMIEKLMDFQERHEKNEARRAFDRAISAARAEIPTITKNRLVSYGHKGGGGSTDYRHEDLAGIASTIDPILARHGLSYRYRTTSEPSEPISVTCIVSHELGHREENSLRAGRDDSGNKNSIQSIGSTITYLQRYTLKASLGLAAGHDDDGAKADAPAPVETVTPEQAQTLRDLVGAIGRTEDSLIDGRINPDHRKQKLAPITTLDELPASAFEGLVKFLGEMKQKEDAANAG